MCFSDGCLGSWENGELCNTPNRWEWLKYLREGVWIADVGSWKFWQRICNCPVQFKYLAVCWNRRENGSLSGENTKDKQQTTCNLGADRKNIHYYQVALCTNTAVMCILAVLHAASEPHFKGIWRTFFVCILQKHTLLSTGHAHRRHLCASPLFHESCTTTLTRDKKAILFFFLNVHFPDCNPVCQRNVCWEKHVHKVKQDGLSRHADTLFMNTGRLHGMEHTWSN